MAVTCIVCYSNSFHCLFFSFFFSLVWLWCRCFLLLDIRDSIFSNPHLNRKYKIHWMDPINYLFICRCCVCWMLNFSTSFDILSINKRIPKECVTPLTVAIEILWHVACHSHMSQVIHQYLPDANCRYNSNIQTAGVRRSGEKIRNKQIQFVALNNSKFYCFSF